MRSVLSVFLIALCSVVQVRADEFLLWPESDRGADGELHVAPLVNQLPSQVLWLERGRDMNVLRWDPVTRFIYWLDTNGSNSRLRRGEFFEDPEEIDVVHPKTIAEFPGYVRDLAIDGDRGLAYVSGSLGSEGYGLYSIRLSDGAIDFVSPTFLQGLAVDRATGDIYGAIPSDRGSEYTIARMDAETFDVDEITTFESFGTVGVAVDSLDRILFWVRSKWDLIVEQTPLAGGEIVEVDRIEGQLDDWPSHITFSEDSGRLFFANGEDGDIYLNTLDGRASTLFMNARVRGGLSAFVPTSTRGRFVRGDCNMSGDVEPISDAVFYLLYHFAGGAEPTCRAACDVNRDGDISGVTDAVALLNFGFSGGPPPDFPYPNCGIILYTPDTELGCEGLSPSCI